ncbi:glutamine amidotransferase-related protein [Bradyrhizobium macuxiense]|uniref:glutamine amidotransferase-related protein n=1 Tax=Bradyrhizobium macuxiense TaxID=1755647 RepID=UPI003221C6A0
MLGGPIGVYETDKYPFLTTEIALLEHRLRREKPTLGICLGAQLMAQALGGRVFPGGVKEIGWGPIELTAMPCGWPRTPITRTRPSPGAAAHWRCNSISRPIHGSSRNGMSATPSSWRQRRSRSPNCARQRRRLPGPSRRKPSRCSATGFSPSRRPTACFVPARVHDHQPSPLMSATSTDPVTDSVM